MARGHAREAGLSIPFKVAAWHELPGKVQGKFDLVVCHGNAIGHCPGERAMVRSLKAIHQVTKSGGYLYLDTRLWEHFRTKEPRYRFGCFCEDEMGRHTIVFRNSVPRKWADPHLCEIIHITEKGGKASLNSYPVTFYAFKKPELLDRLRRSGFDPIETENIGGRWRWR